MYHSVVSTSAIDCLERHIPEMTYYVSSRTLNSILSLTPILSYHLIKLYRSCSIIMTCDTSVPIFYISYSELDAQYFKHLSLLTVM